MSRVTGNYYSAQIGKPTGNGISGPTNRYECIVTDTFTNACAIARSLCNTGETVLGVTLVQENVVVDVDAITDGN